MTVRQFLVTITSEPPQGVTAETVASVLRHGWGGTLSLVDDVTDRMDIAPLAAVRKEQARGNT